VSSVNAGSGSELNLFNIAQRMSASYLAFGLGALGFLRGSGGGALAFLCSAAQRRACRKWTAGTLMKPPPSPQTHSTGCPVAHSLE
jgi:hypothetical protein